MQDAINICRIYTSDVPYTSFYLKNLTCFNGGFILVINTNDKIKILLVFSLCLILFVPLTGFATDTPLINSLEFSTRNLDRVTLSYTSYRVYILRSPNQNIILKEYCNRTGQDYLAIATQKDDVLDIRMGNHPRGNHDFYVEIYIPDNYRGQVYVSTESGRISADSAHLTVHNLFLNSNSGSISAKHITTDELTIRTVSSSVEIDNVTGFIDCKSNGRISVINSSFYGYLVSTSSRIEFSSNSSCGDIYAYSSSGKITANLSASDSFTIEAKTNSGRINNNFFSNIPSTAKSLSATWGEASKKIYIETNSSHIDINMI